MDIDTAVQNTVRALTLSEKELARGLFYSEQYHKQSRTAWVRAPTFGLKQALNVAREGAANFGAVDAKPSKDAFTIRCYRIFCDTLIIAPSDRISPETDSQGSPIEFTIEIFARNIIAPEASAQAPSLTIDMVPDCEILFWTPQIPSTFGVDFNLKGSQKQRIQPAVAAPNLGVAYRQEMDTGSLISEQYGPPDSALENINYLNLIDDKGNVKEKGMLNDDLPRLLQMQLLVAQANVGYDQPLSIKLLNYVIAATATPWSKYLNYQAISLRNSIMIDSDTMAVSSVNIYSSKKVLKARLAAAMAFESAFQKFASDAGSSKSWTISALNMLAKSNDAMGTYEFILEIRQREYDSAVVANNKASTTFKANENEIEARSQAFKKGIDAYKKDQEIKAAKEIIMGFIGIGLAIAATVATAGLAAPAAVGAVGAAAGAAAKTVSLLQKLKAIFDRLKQIYEKIKPVIEKLKEVITTASAVVDALRKFGKAADAAKGLKPDTSSSDVYNATAEWRRFGEAVRDMQDSLNEYDIPGKKEFFFALKTLVINGECYILTQANLITKADELATTIMQKKMEARDRERLSAMAYNSSNDVKVYELLKRAMFDRLLAIRSLVHLDFSTYSSAYSYHTLLRENVITLSPVKPVVDYLEDAAKLQGAVVSYGSRFLVQSRKFRLRSLCGYKSPEALAAQLQRQGSVSLDVDPQDPIWAGFARIRMSSARCYLEGVQPGSSEIIRLRLKTDGRFFDRDYVTTELGDKHSVVRSFLGDQRTLLFEYGVNDNRIVCDGIYGQEQDYTKHTPMASWNIEIVRVNVPNVMEVSEEKAGAQEVTKPQLDMSTVKSVIMEFVCDVVWMG